MKEKLLFTGASGFMGYNILPALRQKYDVCTLGLTHEDNIKINLATEVPLIKEHFDVVLHAAGKAHVVPKTDEEKQAFYDVNYQGTVNLCKGLEEAGVPKALVFVSTVSVYGCDYGEGITEEHSLDGTSPYAMSKKMAEQYLTVWAEAHGVRLGIIRPCLLAGKQAPGNLGAMVKGIKTGRYLNIGGGKAKKSIMMAEDIARLLPLLEEKGGVYNVSDNYQPTYGELSASIARQIGKRRPINIPYWMAWCMAKVGDLLGERAPFNSYRLEKMTKTLTFSNAKARRELGWEPLDVLSHYQI